MWSMSGLYREDSSFFGGLNMKPHTRVTEKEKSPLIIRRYSTRAGILFVSIITDENLDSLDKTVQDFLQTKTPQTIQECRNFAGNLNELLLNTYKKAEGIAVVLYADKMLISSLWGDFMSCLLCKNELYLGLNMMTLV